MQSYKLYQEKLFSTINLREMIPDNHLLIKIDKQVDFLFIYELTKNLYCNDNGYPSIDLVLFFRIQIIDYLFGIQSDRQLCEEVHLNIAYCCFCRLNLEDKVPGHSSLTKIRDRFGTGTFQKIFENAYFIVLVEVNATILNIDTDSRMIVDCHTTTGSRHECTILPERADYILNCFSFKIKEWIADKGYGRGSIYEYILSEDRITCISLHIKNLGEGKISRGEFQYDIENDRYVCPEGHYLYSYDKLDHGIIKRYHVKSGHCKACTLRETCLPAKYQNRSRFIYRNPHQGAVDEVRLRLKERQWKIEGLFAEAKENYCLRRAKYRGIHKFQIQSYMIAIVQNFKRLLSFIFIFVCKIFNTKKN